MLRKSRRRLVRCAALTGFFTGLTLSANACSSAAHDDSVASERGNDTCATGSTTVTMTAYDYQLVFSNYTVKGSCNLGTHVGVGVTKSSHTVSVTYQTSYVPGPSMPGMPGMPGNGAGSSAGICTTTVTNVTQGPETAPGLLNEWYNHGRTVDFLDSVTNAQGNQQQCWSVANATSTCMGGGMYACTIQVGATFNQDQWNLSVAANDAQKGNIEGCLGAIPDGACDSLCGSCKYCIPPTYGLGELGVACTVYDYGPKGISYLWSNSCSLGTQGTNDTTGGHNSNSDAKADIDLFNICASGGPNWPGLVKNVCVPDCGGGGGGNIASPNSPFLGGNVLDACPGSYGFDTNGCGGGTQPTCSPSNGSTGNTPVCGLG